MSRFAVPIGRILVEAALIGLSAADSTVSILSGEADFAGIPFLSGHADSLAVPFAVVAVAGLVVRKRYPNVAFGLTIPALAAGSAVIAALVALFTLAERHTTRTRLIVCAITVFVCYTTPWEKFDSGILVAWNVLYGLIFTGAPVLLGLLMRARATLSSKLDEIERARRHEEELLVEQALARERADLAREMHDVVSHQVSLIAVQAGALQVTSQDEASVQTAKTIRALSVRTLDELRDVVGVLRAAGNGVAGPTPRPGIGDVAALVTDSGVPTTISTQFHAAVTPSPAVQHVVYRAVQEGLTNVAKHAPGATASLELNVDRNHVKLVLTNTKPHRVPDEFPSAQHGLRGLRERAELLGGSLASGRHGDGGYQLSVTLPARV